MREMACTARALHSTGRMDGCPELAGSLLHHSNRNLEFHETQWQQGNAWQAWLWTLGMIAEHYQHDCSGEREHPLNDDPVGSFAEALSHHIGENLPWAECSWEQLLARAMEWVSDDRIIRDSLEEVLGGSPRVNEAYIHWGTEEMMEEVDLEVRKQMGLPETGEEPGL